ncbi:MAG: preprotein translocase subunit SecE, partial [Gaiella sp.]|uniref:preprotein translocase subunit SecE n=1 Tax=Gaiella sp. TaxID=2663207 RepID=UPI003C7859DA
PVAREADLGRGAPRPQPRGGDLSEGGIGNPITKFWRFCLEAVAELKKVEWPTRAQVIQGTIVVIIACIIVGAYLWGADQILKPFVRDVLLGQ